MKRPTPEQIEKIKQLKTEEELIAFAKENGIDLYNTDIRTRYEWTFKYTGIGFTPRANKIDPDVKYVMSAYHFYGDYGTKKEPIPEGFVICELFGIEFLVCKNKLSKLNRDLKNPKVGDFLADFAQYHNERAMFIGVNDGNMPYVSSSANIIQPENICIDGIDIVTEKGTFDISDEKDMALLRKLVDHYKNQRVRLSYWGDPGSYEDRSTYCIIPYTIKTKGDI
ncbi:MAG: hypothetical protein K2N38_05090 [Oscillospiraceae bacterium]|nr:hypothetical protein [Oscillospiraceae bacterium]